MGGGKVRANPAYTLLNTPIILNHHRSPNEVERDLAALDVFGVVANFVCTRWVAHSTVVPDAPADMWSLLRGVVVPTLALPSPSRYNNSL